MKKLKESILCFLGCFCIASGSYMIHPGLGLIVIGAVLLVDSYLLFEKQEQ